MQWRRKSSSLKRPSCLFAFHSQFFRLGAETLLKLGLHHQESRDCVAEEEDEEDDGADGDLPLVAPDILGQLPQRVRVVQLEHLPKQIRLESSTKNPTRIFHEKSD